VADCPVCLMYEKVAVAHGLLDDLTRPAMQTGGVPRGLGGTIQLAQQRLREADDLLHRHVMPMTGWDLGQLCACLEGCAAALDGWLTAPAIGAVAAMAHECRRQAYEVAWAYWARHAPVTT
jgi:hypothetical protein